MPPLWHVLDKLVIIVGIGSLFVPIILTELHIINRDLGMGILIFGFAGALAVRSFLFSWVDDEYDKWRERQGLN